MEPQQISWNNWTIWHDQSFFSKKGMIGGRGEREREREREKGRQFSRGISRPVSPSLFPSPLQNWALNVFIPLLRLFLVHLLLLLFSRALPLSGCFLSVTLDIFFSSVCRSFCLMLPNFTSLCLQTGHLGGAKQKWQNFVGLSVNRFPLCRFSKQL